MKPQDAMQPLTQAEKIAYLSRLGYCLEQIGLMGHRLNELEKLKGKPLMADDSILQLRRRSEAQKVDYALEQLALFHARLTAFEKTLTWHRIAFDILERKLAEHPAECNYARAIEDIRRRLQPENIRDPLGSNVT